MLTVFLVPDKKFLLKVWVYFLKKQCSDVKTYLLCYFCKKLNPFLQ